MSHLLVADIGGTGSRLAVMTAGGPVGTPITYANREYDSFDSILSDFLQRLAQKPSCAALSVAGPVHNNAVTMTNLGWTLESSGLSARFGFNEVRIVNDFAALAWATTELGSADLQQVGGGQALALANRGVLGPGTGLGVSGLVHTGQDWTVVAGEGGHVTLAATTAEEARIIAHVTREHGHCSAERLLSGPGLATLYELIGGERCTPETVSRLAHEGDECALQTLRIFSQLLGTVAADLALTLGARGGIYLGGGILPDIADLFAAAGFRERFEAKGRFENYLANIPTYIIRAAYPSFRGLYAYMQKHKESLAAEIR
jgi:glucokinase